MKRTTVGIVLALLVGLYFLQEGVLARTRVQELERASQNVKEMSAPALLPTYIGSLFLGSFRAVAIDILWIQMQRMGEQEHRYFERVELMDLITKLQPRNPEAWAYMGWDCAYNIANQYKTGEDVERLHQMEFDLQRAPPDGRQDLQLQIDGLKDRIRKKDQAYRIWIRKGLLELVEGCRHLPDDAYLKHEVAKALHTKSAWSNGILERQFLIAVEEDDELQKVLGEGLDPGKRTAFELAEAWYRKGQTTLERLIAEGRFRIYRTLAESMSRPPEEDRRHHTTQMGLNIDLAAFVGFTGEVRYLNGILKWYRAHDTASPEEARRLLIEAAASFRGSAEQADIYRRRHSQVKEGSRAFHDARRELCTGLAELCSQMSELPHPLPAAERSKILAQLELTWWSPVDRQALPKDQVPPTDERYVLDYLGTLKRSLGGDLWEYNDNRHALHRGTLLMPGETAVADIGPEFKDEDWFHYYAAPAPNQGEGPIQSAFAIQRNGSVPLQVLVLALDKDGYRPVQNFPLMDTTLQRYQVTSHHEGPVIIRVSAMDTGAASTAAERGYTLTPVRIKP